MRSWRSTELFPSLRLPPGHPLPGLLMEELMEELVGEVAGPGGRRGEASSGLGVGFGFSWYPGC